MIDVTGEHITKLTDADLRTLVARLCEAELRARMLPISAVTAGGDQDAPDGGIDVRVELPAGTVGLDFVRKPSTGFQVKHSDMPASAITAEMRPKGMLRASIQQLGEQHGAYVIASSEANVTDAVLQARLDAMKQAIHDLAAGSTLGLDFYDRERLASWVRSYPGVALWVRERIGDPIAGWRGYGNWAYRGDFDYLVDPTARLLCLQVEKSEPIPIEQGITVLREALAAPRGVARLIGLSGVGKTRLVQALFDERIGTASLDTSIVIYSDEADAPVPPPRQMLQRLVTLGTRAIVVVDNCNPATHRALAEIALQAESKLSLITIEFDIADDEPEETKVFRLEPASDDVVERILQRLAPQVSQADRRQIADFSGGNARIALALAGTVKKSETLGVLNDAELFRRLFHQKQGADANLEKAAEACSLVYSFDGETIEGGDAELLVLADLAGVSPRDLYRHVEELYARGLLQKRSRWRAVLPQAIANRLARHALERLPLKSVMDAFAKPERARLLASFSRRLGYLHNSAVAREVAEEWFKDEGALGNVADLDDAGVKRFVNIAPIAPTLALNAILAAANDEARARVLLDSKAPHRARWIALVRALAYEAESFDAAAGLLARFVAAEPPNTRSESASGAFTSLFHVILSGTHARIEKRLHLINKLVATADAPLVESAMKALEATLVASGFSGHDFSFGARPRDFGWRPTTDAEVAGWFRAALEACRAMMKMPEHSKRIRMMLARRFRSLWVHGFVEEELEAIALELAAQGGWAEGWIAVRMTMRFDEKRIKPEVMDRLGALEKRLRPTDLRQRVDAYVLARTHDYLDAEEEDGADATAKWKRAAEIAEELGRECASVPDALVDILPEALRKGPGRRYFFGRGLALGAGDVGKLWQDLLQVMTAIPASERDTSVLQGVIAAAHERAPSLASPMLDEAVDHPVLREHFPLLQTAVMLDVAAIARLLRALKAGHAPIWQYGQLNFRIEGTDLEPADYRRLLVAVAEAAGGFPAALQMFESRLFDFKSANKKPDRATIELGRDLLLRCTFSDRDDNIAHHTMEIAAACLEGSDAGDIARTICEKLRAALEDYRTGAWHYGELARTLFRLHPDVALDELVGRRSQDDPDLLHAFTVGSGEIGAVHGASEEALMAWADQNPKERYWKLAREVELFHKPEGSSELTWTPLALQLLSQAPDRSPILKAFAWRLFPRSWSGSLAEILKGYIALVRQLDTRSEPDVREWVQEQVAALSKRAEQETQSERRTDESFE
jgi:hypothetical protein